VFAFSLLTLHPTGFAQTAASPSPRIATESSDLDFDFSACGDQPSLNDKSDPKFAIRSTVVKTDLKNIYGAWINRIPANGRPPKSEKSYIRVRFTLLPEGKLGASAIESSAGDHDEDEAALDAIRSSTLASFPASAGLRSLTLHIRFLINMTCEEASAAERKKAQRSKDVEPSEKANPIPAAAATSAGPPKL